MRNQSSHEASNQFIKTGGMLRSLKLNVQSHQSIKQGCNESMDQTIKQSVAQLRNFFLAGPCMSPLGSGGRPIQTNSLDCWPGVCLTLRLFIFLLVLVTVSSDAEQGPLVTRFGQK